MEITMTYRNGTYIAFDAQGETNQSKSDIKYYRMITAWNVNEHIDFRCVNSHDKTYAVRDSSLDATLEAVIRKRLSYSKNLVVILSKHTRKWGSTLSYEIEQAVERYNLPLIVVYVDYSVVVNPKELKMYWPDTLGFYISIGFVKAIHIPFKKNLIFHAINQFNPHNLPNTSLDFYLEKPCGGLAGIIGQNHLTNYGYNPRMYQGLGRDIYQNKLIYRHETYRTMGLAGIRIDQHQTTLYEYLAMQQGLGSI